MQMVINRGAVLSPIVPGGEVLLKNIRQTGKLATKFETGRIQS